MDTIICIPAREYPEFPIVAAQLDGTSFTESQCDSCQTPIWLGVNSKILCDGGNVPKVCPACSVRVYHVTPGGQPVIALNRVFRGNPNG